MKLKNYGALGATAALIGSLLLPAPAMATEQPEPALSAPHASTEDQTVPEDAEYELQVGDETVYLAEGESATFPLYPVNPPPGEAGTFGTWRGNWGTLTTSGGGGRFYWSIEMKLPATYFSGTATVTNLTSGMSSGRANVSGFSGSTTYTLRSGHNYSGTLDGTAFLAGVPVASTMPNRTNWRG